MSFYIFRKFDSLDPKISMLLILIIILSSLANCNSQNEVEQETEQKEILPLEQGRIFTRWFYSNKFEYFKDQISNSLVKDLTLDNMKKFRKR